MEQRVIIHKRDEKGQPLLQYEGILKKQTAQEIVVEARFGLDIETSYHRFHKGDRMIEWFYTQRWYNIFEMHHFEDDSLLGWYCNITRPCSFEDGHIYADDLALDVMIYPDGRVLVLDEEEFEQLDIDTQSRHQAQEGLQQLLEHIRSHRPPFDRLP